MLQEYMMKKDKEGEEKQKKKKKETKKDKEEEQVGMWEVDKINEEQDRREEDNWRRRGRTRPKTTQQVKREYSNKKRTEWTYKKKTGMPGRRK